MSDDLGLVYRKDNNDYSLGASLYLYFYDMKREENPYKVLNPVSQWPRSTSFTTLAELLQCVSDDIQNILTQVTRWNR